TSVEVLTTASIEALAAFLEEHPIYTDTAALDNAVEFSDEFGIRYRIQSTSEDLFARDLLLTTGSETHLTALASIQENLPILPSATAIYAALGLAYIEPELREGLGEIGWAQSGQLPTLISFADLKGTLHNHS